MKKLELQLGTDVWLREGRSLRLTQACQYLFTVVNGVLPQLDLTEERLGQEIDLRVTPDPLYKPGLKFVPVFNYQQVLVVATRAMPWLRRHM